MNQAPHMQQAPTAVEVAELRLSYMRFQAEIKKDESLTEALGS